MVGAGILALLGIVALVAGNETHISFLGGGGVAALSGHSYAKLGARYPDAGGLTAFFHGGQATARRLPESHHTPHTAQLLPQAAPHEP